LHLRKVLVGMKAHIGVDAEFGLVHTVVGTAANVSDVTQAGALLHGDETTAFGDAGYRGVAKREKAQGPLLPDRSDAVI
jgi:IS5 family transposase